MSFAQPVKVFDYDFWFCEVESVDDPTVGPKVAFPWAFIGIPGGYDFACLHFYFVNKV